MDEIVCNGCGKREELDFPKRYHQWSRSDAYGIFTGYYCDECYEDNYPYRKDEYFDSGYAGERLEEEEW